MILTERSGKTHMIVTIECGSKERLEQFLKFGIDKGTAQTLDNLVAYVMKVRQQL